MVSNIMNQDTTKPPSVYERDIDDTKFDIYIELNIFFVKSSKSTKYATDG